MARQLVAAISWARKARARHACRACKPHLLALHRACAGFSWRRCRRGTGASRSRSLPGPPRRTPASPRWVQACVLGSCSSAVVPSGRQLCAVFAQQQAAVCCCAACYLCHSNPVAERLWVQTRFRDGRLVSTKGDKYIVEKASAVPRSPRAVLCCAVSCCCSWTPFTSRTCSPAPPGAALDADWRGVGRRQPGQGACRDLFLAGCPAAAGANFSTATASTAQPPGAARARVAGGVIPVQVKTKGKRGPGWV